jgi:hypothetical protein
MLHLSACSGDGEGREVSWTMQIRLFFRRAARDQVFFLRGPVQREMTVPGWSPRTLYPQWI